MMSAPFSAIMMIGALALPQITDGITDRSIIRLTTPNDQELPQ
jgi:hypothetical protein